MGQMHQGKQNIFLTLSKHTSKSFLKGNLLYVFFLFQKLKRRKSNDRKKVWLVKGKEDQSSSVFAAPRGPQIHEQ